MTRMSDARPATLSEHGSLVANSGDALPATAASTPGLGDALACLRGIPTLLVTDGAAPHGQSERST